VTLKPYEDRDVVASTIKIVRAGDGLSEALTVDPVEYHVGDEVHVVLRTECTKVTYEPVKDTDVLRRVHTLSTAFGTIVDEAFAKAVLAEQQLIIEKAKGIQRIPGVDEDGE
jgi:hypothetical protein